MSDDRPESPPPPSPPASSLVSPSPDALDSPSVGRLTRALLGIERELSVSNELHRLLRRELVEQRKVMSATRLDVATLRERAFSAVAEERVAIERATARIERAAEETGKHMLPPTREADDEITAEHLKIRWRTLGGFFARHTWLLVKIFGALAAAAGVAWAWLTHVVHR